ncbi:MAG: hypothetical protein Kow00114_03870 [Kiloniellaceae bacterium]
MTQIFLAIVIGGAFGFVLDRVGATNPNYIIGMLRLGNLHLMKTILLAIGASSLLMFLGLWLGLIDPGHLSVKSAYLGVFLGGLLLGLGFAAAGYCPGTGLAAAATGRKDALAFVLGGLLGAAAYMASFAWVESTGVLDAILGGKSTLGAIAGTDYPALMPGLPGELVGIVLGLVLIAVAFLLPDSLRGGGALQPAKGRHAHS